MLDMETGAREGKDLEQIALQLEDVKSILSGLPVASAWMS
jgi:hypothetical protein